MLIEEHRNLRQIFGLRKHENGEKRTLQNDELHNFYSSPKIVRITGIQQFILLFHIF